MAVDAETTRLITRLEATHKDFARDMQRAQAAADKRLRQIDARVSKTSRSFSRFGKTAAGAVAGILTAAAARRLISGIEGAIDRLDDIAKTAGKIGLTTDALQELRVAANLSGVETRQLEKALVRYAVALDEARQGTGEGAEAFRLLGVDVRDAFGAIKTGDEVFRDVADALSRIEDPITKSARAAEIFGTRSGIAMINMLEGGAVALDRLRAKARELGIVIDADLIRRSVEAKDELFLMKQMIDTQLTVALVELAPALVDITGFLADLAWVAGLAWRGMRRLAGVQLDADEVTAITEDIVAARAELAKLDEEFKTFESEGISPLAKSLGFSGEPLPVDELNQRLDDFANRRAEIVTRLEGLEERLQKAVSSTAEDLVPPALPERPGGAGVGGGAGTRSAAPTFSLEVEMRSLEREADALRLRIKLIGMNTREAAEFLAVEELLNRARREGIELTPAEEREIRKLGAAIGDLAEQEERARAEVEATTEATEEQTRAAQDAARALGDMFVQALEDGADLKILLGELAKKLAEISLNALNQRLSGGPSAGGGGLGGLGGILGGIAGAILGGKAGGSKIKSFSLPFGFAEGGRPQPGRPALVGERGPELFVPDTAGTIIPNGAAIGPSISVTIENNFALGVTPTVRAEINAATPRIVAAAKAGVAEAAQRGGAFAKGVRG